MGTNTVSTDVLIARVAALTTVLSNVQAQATQVMDLEPKIAELERLRAEQQKNYESVMARIEQQQRDESMVAGKVINMSQVQSPTPPGLDYKKMMKLVGVVLAGCIGMGLGLAFVIDLFLDRSIKRSSDVERHLRLPVFLSIPDTSWAGWLRLPRGWPAGGAAKSTAPNGAGRQRRRLGEPPWRRGIRRNQLQTYTEGLARADHQLL